MREIQIDGHSYEISFTVYAYQELCELCGSIDKISSYIKSGNAHDKLKKIALIFINAAERQKKYYQKIDTSLEDDRKSEKITLPKFLKSKDIISIYNGIFKEIKNALYHEIPPNVNISKSETDIDLEEIKQQRADKEGIKRPNKVLPIIAKGLSSGLDYSTIINAMTPGEVIQIWLYQQEGKGGLNGKK